MLSKNEEARAFGPTWEDEEFGANGMRRKMNDRGAFPGAKEQIALLRRGYIGAKAE